VLAGPHDGPDQLLWLHNSQDRKAHPDLIHEHRVRQELGEEPVLEPIERFQVALNGEVERLAVRRVGETFVCPKT